MKIVKTVVRVHKVHMKNNGAFTVGLIIQQHMDNGAFCSKYANQKYTKRPKIGTEYTCKAVITEKNKNGFSWVTGVE
ncbi:unnamed protein product [marine sediment metagenome]|uniref:Uncharacterized protein n=1 Tax=marine sediment metagenome TaxID=412755 RepID=X0RYS3_9ZZZZ